MIIRFKGKTYFWNYLHFLGILAFLISLLLLWALFKTPKDMGYVNFIEHYLQTFNVFNWFFVLVISGVIARACLNQVEES